MAGSFITDDLGVLFASSDFGEASGTVTWKGNPVTDVIFDDEDVEVEAGEGVAQIVPRANMTGKAADFPNIADGDAVVINGVSFEVRNWMNDGTGVIEIFLERV